MFRSSPIPSAALCIGLAIVALCSIPSAYGEGYLSVTSENLTIGNVDLFGKFFRRLTGAEEVVKEQQGYQMGRQQEIQSRMYGLGAGLAVLIILCMFIWGLTLYAWWRLHQIRKQGNIVTAQPVSVPMISPSVRIASPQPLPSGPKLVSQKIIGAAPRVVQSSPVRMA